MGSSVPAPANEHEVHMKLGRKRGDITLKRKIEKANIYVAKNRHFSVVI